MPELNAKPCGFSQSAKVDLAETLASTLLDGREYCRGHAYGAARAVYRPDLWAETEFVEDSIKQAVWQQVKLRVSWGRHSIERGHNKDLPVSLRLR